MTDAHNELEQMLERVTAAEGAGDWDADSDPETRALREVWVDFGRLLEASQPAAAIALDRWKTPRPADRRRRMPTMATLAAASLLVGVVAVWMWGDANPAASNGRRATSAQQGRRTGSDKLQWTDKLDEQIVQVGWNILYARQDVYGEDNDSSLIQDDIEQMQQELEENYL